MLIGLIIDMCDAVISSFIVRETNCMLYVCNISYFIASKTIKNSNFKIKILTINMMLYILFIYIYIYIYIFAKIEKK